MKAPLTINDAALAMDGGSKFLAGYDSNGESFQIDLPQYINPEGVIQNLDRKSDWVKEVVPLDDQLLITSVRQDPAPGTHEIKYSSSIDGIEIRHTAKNRHGFALGAILAAEYLVDKQGLFTMKEVLGL